MALTQHKVEQLRKKYGIQTPSSVDPATTQNKSGFMTKIKEDFNKRGGNISKSVNSKQSLLSKAIAFPGQGAGFVGDVISEGVKAVTQDSVERKVADFVAPVATSQLAQDIAQKYTTWKAQNPEAAQNLENIINIGTLIPITKGAQVAGKVGAEVAGRGLVTAGIVAENTGKVVKGGGKMVYKSAITPNVKEAERILKFEADTTLLDRLLGKAKNEPITRADTALDKGLGVRQRDIGIQAKRESMKLYKNTIAPALENSKDIITKEEMFAPIIERINKTIDPTKKKGLQESFESLQSDYADFNEFSLKDAQALKHELDEFTPDKVFRGKQVSNEDVVLRNDMANAIRQKTYDSLKDQNIRKAYLDYGNLKELEKVGVKAISEAGTKGGFGTFWSSIWDMATTPIKTVGGLTLYRVGNKLEFTGESGIKKFGQFLQSKGFKRRKQK